MILGPVVTCFSASESAIRLPSCLLSRGIVCGATGECDLDANPSLDEIHSLLGKIPT
jgi:hypothetical protein